MGVGGGRIISKTVYFSSVFIGGGGGINRLVYGGRKKTDID